MQKIIAALSTKTNAMLESPTGTGKTLALLASTLHYLEGLKEDYAKK
jgi:Rad3-related DNA helicase